MSPRVRKILNMLWVFAALSLLVLLNLSVSAPQKLYTQKCTMVSSGFSWVPEPLVVPEIEVSDHPLPPWILPKKYAVLEADAIFYGTYSITVSGNVSLPEKTFLVGSKGSFTLYGARIVGNGTLILAEHATDIIRNPAPGKYFLQGAYGLKVCEEKPTVLSTSLLASSMLLFAGFCFWKWYEKKHFAK